MASSDAVQRKLDWMRMSEECFETLTFGELKVGQRFIGLPHPGDNGNHGGFRTAHYILTKTHKVATEAAPGVPYSTPHGTAMSESMNLACDLPHYMPVILVE